MPAAIKTIKGKQYKVYRYNWKVTTPGGDAYRFRTKLAADSVARYYRTDARKSRVIVRYPIDPP